MKEDDDHIIKVESKPFFGSLVSFFFLFGTFFISLVAYMSGNVLISLLILAFAVIILLLIRRGIRKNKIIVSDFRENKEPKVALNEKNKNSLLHISISLRPIRKVYLSTKKRFKLSRLHRRLKNSDQNGFEMLSFTCKK